MNQHFLWHWKQQTVPLRGKNYITGDPTQHVIIPKPFFSKVLQVFHCTAALQPVAETLEIIKGSWFVISNISNYPFFSHFSSLERLFCKSMKSKNPVIFSPLRCVDRCVVARIMAMSHEKKNMRRLRTEEAPSASPRVTPCFLATAKKLSMSSRPIKHSPLVLYSSKLAQLLQLLRI